ncbi:DUF751 domain-containing protein [Lyngbya aestuarii]|uniref:DUF751 domain-containing protein n=1 Tax=Lyngbya aestuarii TaxID=118322 RepID=UPI00403DD1FA
MFEGFWQNVSRYPRYLISFTLGIFYSVYLFFKPLLQNPISAIAFIGLVVGSFFFISFTLRAMLGLSPV